MQSADGNGQTAAGHEKQLCQGAWMDQNVCDVHTTDGSWNLLEGCLGWGEIKVTQRYMSNTD